MAEILGVVASGVTIASLVKVCLEAFDLIQVARKQGIDYEKLSLRLNIERARLYTWGQAMGLANADPDGTTNLLRSSPFQPLVQDTLELIIRLFNDGEKLQSSYGCAKYSNGIDRKRGFSNIDGPESPDESAVEKLAASFSRFRIFDKQPNKKDAILGKGKWMIKDRQKFSELVQEIRSLIDGLQDMTKSLSTIARQEGMLRYGIQQIKDPETLTLISDICLLDYPDISDAASVKVDVLTIATDHRQAIQSWATSVKHSADAIDDDDLELLTITELKDQIRRMRRGMPGTGMYAGPPKDGLPASGWTGSNPAGSYSFDSPADAIRKTDYTDRDREYMGQRNQPTPFIRGLHAWAEQSGDTSGSESFIVPDR